MVPFLNSLFLGDDLAQIFSFEVKSSDHSAIEDSTMLFTEI